MQRKAVTGISNGRETLWHMPKPTLAKCLSVLFATISALKWRRILNNMNNVTRKNSSTSAVYAAKDLSGHNESRDILKGTIPDTVIA